LEKYKKKWIGGRTSNDTFYGTQIVTGAGVGRKNKDKQLIELLDELGLQTTEFDFKPYYSTQIKDVVDVKKVMQQLKNKYIPIHPQTFKEFAKPILGATLYNDFLVSVGYTDYENADALDVINNYGMEDNACCWKGFHVNWKELVTTLADEIGHDKIKTSMNYKKYSLFANLENVLIYKQLLEDEELADQTYIKFVKSFEDIAIIISDEHLCLIFKLDTDYNKSMKETCTRFKTIERFLTMLAIRNI
jgi:hypothetical protein